MASHSGASFESYGSVTTLAVSVSQGGEKPQRPSFSSAITSDRLRESEKWTPAPTRLEGTVKASGNGTRSRIGGVGRRSVFKEIGLEDDEIANTTGLSQLRSSSSSASKLLADGIKEKENAKKEVEQRPWYAKLAKPSRPVLKTVSSAPPATFSTLPRVAIIAFLIAIVIPGINYRGTGNWNSNVPGDGVGAGPVRGVGVMESDESIQRRADSSVDVCTRWSHQSAVVNGTVYIYGGQAKTSPDQNSETWNNNFISLDLTQTWAISSPSLSGLPQSSGPPAVANGYLWNSFTSLFLYGGLFSDTPPTTPLPFSLWEYSLGSKSWIQHSSPITTSGNNSDPQGLPVQRSAEGAGLSVPELGLSWYFGGHQDMYTTLGWSNQIARIYLKSLLEFTHPGFMNDGVQGLGIGGKGASSDGAYRNITEGGVQEQAGFTERADGVLVYIPGWGTKGILLGLAGGTNQQTFTEMNVIDIYDIASSTWYKQATSGTSPSIRVNPCAVVFAAPDASSFNVYMYGGQNLQPYEGQTQYSDLWILTIPSFTWIQADLNGQSQPPARAGHTCHAWDGQMVVVGGYVGTQISCDSPGIYVFNASSLSWQNNFAALSGSNSQGQQNSQASQASPGAQPTQGSQGSQLSGGDLGGLSGSYGYQVPPAIQSVVGGNAYGAATATTPAAGPATDGPIATGKPPTFTITQSASTVIETTYSTSTSNVSSNPPVSSSGPNIAAIVAGVIAGVLAILAGYLAFCTWLYRRQISLYKNHVAISQRAALGNSHSPEARTRNENFGPLLGAFGTEIGRSHDGRHSGGRSSDGGNSGPGSGLAATRTDSHSTEYMGAAGVAAGERGPHSWVGMSDRASVSSSTEDLLDGQEPSFINVVLSPRRTLRVINRD